MELGIKGHETRGDEVIKILETLGGKNHYKIKLTGDVENHFYYITNHYKDINNSYIGPDEIKGYMIFSLEDFLEKFPYKVGDKVKVWINYEHLSGPRAELEDAEIKSMRWNSARCEIAYKMKDITREFYKDDIKGKVNDDEEHKTDTSIDYGDKCNNGKIIEKSEMNMNDNNVDLTLKGEIYHGNRISYVIPDGYEFSKIENNEIIIQKKKPIYPKTYEECCELLGKTKAYQSVSGYKTELLEDLQKLLICRDAYWKIAGEEMELGKSWEPDYDSGVNKYGIICMNGVVQKSNPTTNWERHLNKVLDFPIEKMRNAFYENFKDLIEDCKDLL